MNTPAHLIFGAALFARPGQPRVNIAALAGSLTPDLSLYLLVAWEMLKRTPTQVIFGQLYFSPEWQAIFAVDNSFFVWGGFLILGALLRSPAAIAFAGAGLLHLAFDFPLHHDDGRPHFWPLTMWVFESPLSYWDSRAHGDIVGAIEILACLALLVLLWRRFQAWPARLAIAGTGTGLAGPTVLFGMMF
ncbi:cobalamin biosynthesis protein CobQ [Halovulum dunhuangense]|uniref:Cobalamin biosynthesis protein CobQ n=1 Tax=Halovulum dunhuangense TaxID=1505036 RepID=A0A849L4R9_9RHOB|nr:cobalamin biosynthesis protein CobQ [Halovulum dunhuangense]NNU81355.1 cobalamin biosynthesis protein CobQ [Halovulum dunhuangense]